MVMRLALALTCAQACGAHVHLRVSDAPVRQEFGSVDHAVHSLDGVNEDSSPWHVHIVDHVIQARDYAIESGERHAPVMVSLLQKVTPMLVQTNAPPAGAAAGTPAIKSVTPFNQFVGCLINAVIVVCFAYFYLRYRCIPTPGSETKEPAFDDWNTGFCDWYQEPGTATCAFCCPMVRWSENISEVVGLLTFWTALLISVGLTACECMSSLPTLSILGWIAVTLVRAAYRQELRNKFNFANKGSWTFVTDILMHLCCSCCAITQEARHIEDALVQGSKAVEVPEGRNTSDSREACLTCLAFSEQKC